MGKGNFLLSWNMHAWATWQLTLDCVGIQGIPADDEDPFSPCALFRRLRRRRRLAVSGAARGSFVLVPDMAGTAGSAHSQQPAGRRAAEPNTSVRDTALGQGI